MEQVPTFEQIPQELASLRKEVSELKPLLLALCNLQSTTPPEQLLTVKEAAKFLNLSVPTIYSKVSKGELPYMKRGKRLHFSNAELMQYLKEGRKLTNSEIEKEAQNYIQKHS